MDCLSISKCLKFQTGIKHHQPRVSLASLSGQSVSPAHFVRLEVDLEARKLVWC